MHLDGVHLGRPLVERPQISVDADFCYQALVVLWNLVGLASTGHAILSQIFACFGQRVESRGGAERGQE